MTNRFVGARIDFNDNQMWQPYVPSDFPYVTDAQMSTTRSANTVLDQYSMGKRFNSILTVFVQCY